MSCSFLHSKYLNVRPWTSESDQEEYLWSYWSHASRALCTPGTVRRCRTRSGRSSPNTVILVSCIVPALRSVCYKYTATGNLWTVAEHTGSHLCSTLQISRRVSHRDWWFVVHKEKRMRRTPTCGAPVHNLSDTAKCNTGAPQSQATCNIGEEMKIWIVLNHMCKKCEKNWEGKPHTGADISEAAAEPNRPLPWHVVDTW